jgi:hypothetical protein
MNWIFDGSKHYFVGYTATHFEIVVVEQETNIYGNYRIHTDVIKAFCRYDEIEFDIVEQGIYLRGIKNDNILSSSTVKREEDINIASANYCQMIASLRGGRIYDLRLLRDFEKLMVLPKCEGLIIKDGYVYTEGESFKCFSKTDSDLELMLAPTVLKKLLKLLDGNTLFFDVGNYFIIRNGSFYFGFKRMRATRIETFSVISKLPVNGEVILDFDALYSLIKTITSSSVSMSFNLKNNTLRLQGKVVDILFALPSENRQIFSEDKVEYSLDLAVVKGLLKAVGQAEKVLLRNYDKFTLLVLGDLFVLVKNVNR